MNHRLFEELILAMYCVIYWHVAEITRQQFVSHCNFTVTVRGNVPAEMCHLAIVSIATNLTD